MLAAESHVLFLFHSTGIELVAKAGMEENMERHRPVLGATRRPTTSARWYNHPDIGEKTFDEQSQCPV